MLMPTCRDEMDRKIYFEKMAKDELKKQEKFKAVDGFTHEVLFQGYAFLELTSSYFTDTKNSAENNLVNPFYSTS